MNRLKPLFVLIVMFFISIKSVGQNTQASLQSQQASLQNEINNLNTLLSSIKSSKKQSANAIQIVMKKIKVRQQLMSNLKTELQLVDYNIRQNELSNSHVKVELDSLKSAYAKNIVFQYKKRNNLDYLYFLFSSKDFNDALQRLFYMKTYQQYQEAQLKKILSLEKTYKDAIVVLHVTKQQKGNILLKQNQVLQSLSVDQEQQKKFIDDLQKKENEVSQELADKQKQRQKIRNLIANIIKKEARLANNNKKSQDRSNNNTPTNRIYSPFENTTVGKEESIEFEKERGHLLWPVGKGFISLHFGNYIIPATKLKGNSEGIEIIVPNASPIQSIANGIVSFVGDEGDGKIVLVRSGKYFTTYSHLESATVTQGQTVQAGTILGKAAKDNDNEYELFLMITDDKGQPMDPENWLSKTNK